MHEFEGLKQFTRTLINFIGNGYIYCQVSRVPDEKMQDIQRIKKKLNKKYNLQATQGQRQHRKRKNKCNYRGLTFRGVIIILKTKGEDTYHHENWDNILGKEIVFKKLSIVPYKDERGKLTVRIGKSYLKEIRRVIDNVISKQDVKGFDKVIMHLYNLHRTVRYRGLQLQVSQLLKEIKAMQKQQGTRYKVREFFTR